MPDRPFAFHDLSADQFPLVIKFYPVDGDKCIHRIDVPGAGAIHIPNLRDGHGPVRVEITYGDGTLSAWPEGGPDESGLHDV